PRVRVDAAAPARPPRSRPSRRSPRSGTARERPRCRPPRTTRPVCTACRTAQVPGPPTGPAGLPPRPCPALSLGVDDQAAEPVAVVLRIDRPHHVTDGGAVLDNRVRAPQPAVRREAQVAGHAAH